eukprot:TRINITY_DN20254_c0_g3_i1.p1 TRINITY_DN20254_c0_g3~~TRINITY_DN20254_c0_g3_i1.p1  ORF type:complete len:565 (-),score=90.86 TRINITY_DN20254_c0_g3_i1:367-1980(-)
MTFVRASRRLRRTSINLVIFEKAHASLGADDTIKEAVMNFEGRYRLQVLQSVFISARSLEDNPIVGIDKATMVVPGTPSYTIVASQGGLGGPEVFSLHAEKAIERKITVPLRIVVLRGTGTGLVQDIASLKDAHGVTRVEVVPSESGGATEVQVKAIDGEVKKLTDSCEVTLDSNEVSDALLVIGNPDLIYVLQALGRLSFSSEKKKAGYILIPAGSAKAAATAWRALAEHDERVDAALQEAAILSGKLGRPLQWEDLPVFLQDVVVDISSAGMNEESQKWIVEVVNEAMYNGADEWDMWYGHLLAYREKHGKAPGDPIPLDATIHGAAIGKWVSQQFMEWRADSLEASKREKLVLGGLSLEDESDRYFTEGLQEFEQHYKANPRHDPLVPSGYFTPSGFPLGAWTLTQRSNWLNNRLGVDQKYLLYGAGFGPAHHPENNQAREATIVIERSLRAYQNHPLEDRQRLFRTLVIRHHPTQPSSKLVGHAAEITRFLSGWRDWFLNPPAPPLPEGSEPDLVEMARIAGVTTSPEVQTDA